MKMFLVDSNPTGTFPFSEPQDQEMGEIYVFEERRALL